MESVETYIQRLEAWFAECDGAVVAFSAGVDSSLVAYAARRFLGADKSLAVISTSPSLKRSDLDLGRTFCEKYDIRLREIQTKETEDPDYLKNGPDRCYFCKSNLYFDLSQISKEFPDWRVMNGANVDDLGDYRPGLKAAKEFEVHAPLSDCGMTKDAIRAVAAQYELECWNKPASPCMSSRIPYGQEVTLHKLEQIEAGESFLNELGFDIVRLRHYGSVAQIEVPAEKLEWLMLYSNVVKKRMRELGFESVEFDKEGFVSGKLNRVLS